MFGSIVRYTGSISTPDMFPFLFFWSSAVVVFFILITTSMEAKSMQRGSPAIWADNDKGANWTDNDKGDSWSDNDKAGQAGLHLPLTFSSSCFLNLSSSWILSLILMVTFIYGSCKISFATSFQFFLLLNS